LKKKKAALESTIKQVEELVHNVVGKAEEKKVEVIVNGKEQNSYSDSNVHGKAVEEKTQLVINVQAKKENNDEHSDDESSKHSDHKHTILEKKMGINKSSDHQNHDEDDDEDVGSLLEVESEEASSAEENLNDEQGDGMMYSYMKDEY